MSDDLTNCPNHGPQEKPHETEESTKDTADPMPSMKVECSRADRADPRSRGKNLTRLIEIVRL